MKKCFFFNLVFILFLSLVFSGCEVKTEEDDDTTTNGTSSSSGYSFKDQTLQGKLGGLSWTFVSGVAETSLWDATEISIDLYDSAPSGDDPCASDAFSFSSSRILFSVKNAAGLTELSFGNEDSQTITFYDAADNMNNIAVEGAIEIISISDTEVTGRMDATADSDNFANGNFTIKFCTE